MGRHAERRCDVSAVPRAHLERLDGILVVGGREDHPGQVAHLAEHFEAVPLRHPHVQEAEVGALPIDERHGGGQVVRLADDDEVRVIVDQPPQAVARRLLVVDDRHAVRHGAPTGTRSRATVPRPDLGYVVGFAGQVSRNTVIGPSLVQLDFSTTKNFKITESQRIQFRTEVFNLPNHPNFRIPNSGLFNNNGTRNVNAGRVDSTRTTERQIQFGLKYIF